MNNILTFKPRINPAPVNSNEILVESVRQMCLAIAYYTGRDDLMSAMKIYKALGEIHWINGYVKVSQEIKELTQIIDIGEAILGPVRK